VAGYIAKGLAIAGAGVLVIVAASRSQPNKATGLDGALKTLGAQPYGAALLIAAAWESSPTACRASPWPDTPKCKWLWRTQPASRSGATTLASQVGRLPQPKQGIHEVRSCVRPAAQNSEVPTVQTLQLSGPTPDRE
jgi:hypothetical protein